MNFHFKYVSTRSGKAVLLFLEKRRYLFNCFEGFQRYSLESSTKLSTLNSVFLCSVNAVPALIGTYLTMGDMGRAVLNVIGVGWYEQVFMGAKAFANRKKLKCSFTQAYADEFIDVELVEIDGECSYVIDLPKIRGKLLADLIPAEFPKKLYSRLGERRVVEFDGRMYNGGDFLEDDIHPGRVAIVYSHRDYEGITVRLEALKIDTFIVFDAECAEHLKRHLSGVFYVLADNNFVEFTSFYTIQSKASAIDTNYILPSSGSARPSSDEEHALHSCDVLKFNKKERKYDLQRSGQTQHTDVAQNAEETPAVFFLGTGCALPSKYRNVTAILVQTHAFSYLLDCGEDTLSQISRTFGSLDVLRTLNFIFISHSHADHHLGLVAVLGKAKEYGVRVKVFAPVCVKEFVDMFFDEDVCDFYSTREAVLMKRAFEESGSPKDDVERFFLKFDVDVDITVCGVTHCVDSCGIRVDTEDLTLAYSGDTCADAFVKVLAADCDVLIHEATFSDELTERASATKHSTVSDALEVWRFSRAKKLVLTHLSQRYKAHESLDGNVTLASDLFRYLPKKSECPNKKRAINALFQAKEAC